MTPHDRLILDSAFFGPIGYLFLIHTLEFTLHFSCLLYLVVFCGLSVQLCHSPLRDAFMDCCRAQGAVPICPAEGYPSLEGGCVCIPGGEGTPAPKDLSV